MVGGSRGASAGAGGVGRHGQGPTARKPYSDQELDGEFSNCTYC